MPPRQSFVLPERPAPRAPLPPLNIGFAGRPPSPFLAVSQQPNPVPPPRDLRGPSSSSSSLAPPRSDGQEILPYQRGSKRLAIDIASNAEALVLAKEELKNRIFAKSNVGAVAAKKETWADVARAAGFTEPFTPDPDLLYTVCAALWKAHYRSLDSYIAVAKQEMIMLHGNLSDTFLLHIKRVNRAAARGKGPAKQACELPFGRFLEFADRAAPLSPGGPAYPGRVAVIASWWMLREIELMNVSLDCVTLQDEEAKLLLPVSKTDYTGKGTSRSLCCTCSSTAFGLCPFHTLQEQHRWASSLASASPSSPLCPDLDGAVPTKKHVVETILAMAQWFNLELHTRSGAPRFTGHTFRVSGAMWLAASGIDLWRIQLHGRWGSDTVLRYVRLAPLAKTLALEASMGKDLSDVRAALLQAKATLADMTPLADAAPLDDKLAEALGPLGKPAGFLGKPTVDQVLGNSSVKGWKRLPKHKELLVCNVGPPNYDNKLHSLRPPVIWKGEAPEMSDWDPTCQKAWCSWGFQEAGNRADLHLWDKHTDDPDVLNLCGRCFGKRKSKKPSSSSSDSE